MSRHCEDTVKSNHMGCGDSAFRCEISSRSTRSRQTPAWYRSENPLCFGPRSRSSFPYRQRKCTRGGQTTWRPGPLRNSVCAFDCPQQLVRGPSPRCERHRDCVRPQIGCAQQPTERSDSGGLPEQWGGSHTLVGRPAGADGSTVEENLASPTATAAVDLASERCQQLASGGRSERRLRLSAEDPWPSQRAGEVAGVAVALPVKGKGQARAAWYFARRSRWKTRTNDPVGVASPRTPHVRRACLLLAGRLGRWSSGVRALGAEGPVLLRR